LHQDGAAEFTGRVRVGQLPRISAVTGAGSSAAHKTPSHDTDIPEDCSKFMAQQKEWHHRILKSETWWAGGAIYCKQEAESGFVPGR